MARIRVLDKMVAELIAAGEVVERPASVVKELVENSIDAGATKIEVEIKGGGIGYIRISDNGSGIDSKDIQNAFMRHATSKVFTADDLISIDTLGFRGEALASISAVSKIELVTKTKDSIHGWGYGIVGGEGEDAPNQIGAPDGTTLIIRDIFYNTPARMKFLRSDISEGNAVAQIVDKCALSHPEIAFTFIRDTKTRLQTSGNGDLLAVIARIYGRDFANEMIKVDYIFENHIKIYGFVGTPNNSKPTRSYQNFFINKRYVRTTTCSVALKEAFKGRLMIGRFPVGVLFVDVDSSKVDANVHPAKIEVRFSEEKSIYNSVYFGVKNALMQTERRIGTIVDEEETELKNSHIEENSSAIKTKRLSPFEPFVAPTKPKYNYNIDIEVEDAAVQQQKITPILSREEIDPKEILNLSSSARVSKNTEFTPLTNTVLTSFQESNKIDEACSDEMEEENPSNELDLKFVGELFNTYILLENQQKELLLVDKHAAHERIKYEEIKTNSLSENRQVLLAAIPVTLQREEYSVLLQNLDILNELGFLVEDFGTGTVIVRETAVLLDGQDIPFILSEIASNLMDGRRDLTPERINRLYYSIACKSAIRGGDKNQEQELMEIIKKLEENPEITHCPHGRPVTVKLSRKDIEKMFGRLG